MLANRRTTEQEIVMIKRFHGFGKQELNSALLLAALVVGLGVLVAPQYVEAQPKMDDSNKEAAAKDDSEQETVKIGVIASQRSIGGGGASAIDVETAGAAPGDELSVIMGSVAPSGNGKCLATVTNSSEENSYSVRFAVEGYNERGNRTLHRNFSAMIRPKSTIERTVSCRDNLNLQVKLKSARKR